MSRVLAALLLLGSAVGIACKKDTLQPTPDQPGPQPPGPDQPGSQPPGPVEPGPTAKEALQLITDGKVTARHIARSFGNVIAFTANPSDPEVPFDGARAVDWMQKAGRGLKVTPTEYSRSGETSITRGEAEGPAGKRYIELRLIETGGSPKALIEWFQVSTLPYPSGPRVLRSTAWETPQVARCFAAAALGGDELLLGGLTGPKLRAKLGPPTPADKHGYNPAALRDKLKAMLGEADRFEVALSQEGGSANANGRLTVFKGAERRVFRIALATEDTPPQGFGWVVTDISPE